MLNPFPFLLTYGIYAPTLLRIAAACVLFFIARQVVYGAQTLTEIPFPVVGKTNIWVSRVAAGITVLVGIALLVGYATQWAAIIGVLIGIKLMWFQKKLAPIRLLQNSTCCLFIIICISLLLTGAGALAFDLPL